MKVLISFKTKLKLPDWENFGFQVNTRNAPSKSELGILKFLISLGWSSISLVLEVDRQQRKEHRSFQERCAIACALAHTYLKGFKSDKLLAQIKLLTRRCITNEGKTAKNEWENDGCDFLQALHSVYM